MTSAHVIYVFTFLCCIAAIITNWLYSYETVPFLLKHNYREDEALYILSKLRGEDSNSISLSVRNDFEAIRQMCDDDCAQFDERKIFTQANKHPLYTVLYGRISAVLTFSVPIVVLFVKFFQLVIFAKLMRQLIGTMEELQLNDADIDQIEEDIHKMENEIFVFRHAIQAVLFTWFIFGIVIMLVVNYFDWRRKLHYTSALVGCIMLVCSVIFLLNILLKLIIIITLFCLVIYFKFLSFPIDMIGHTYLADAFPVSNKSRSIAFVCIVENLIHILFIALDLQPKDFGYEFTLLGLGLAVAGYKLYRTAPNTKGMTLTEAREEFMKTILKSK